MCASSRNRAGLEPGRRSVRFLAGCALILAAPVAGHAADRAGGARSAGTLTAPLLDGPVYVGDVEVTGRRDGSNVTMPAARLLDLLANLIEPAALARVRAALAGRTAIGPGPIGPDGIALRYEPARVELGIDIPAGLRIRRPFSIAARVPGNDGAIEQPARFSAYLTARGSLRINDRPFGDGGIQGALLLDGAVRIHDIVLESDGVWQSEAGFQRHGTRLVYDDPGRALRFSAGDLLPVVQGYQVAPQLAGISLLRSYSLLQPHSIVRPFGRESFTLERPSVVEAYVNDQLVRRINLQPGRYDLRDFPFAQGANDVRLVLRGDDGDVETLRFHVFFDQTQLAAGLNEFGLFAGVYAPVGLSGPIYSGRWGMSGFYRQGFSDYVTAGANFQADADGMMAGAEALVSTGLGTIRAQAAVSRHNGLGSGVSGGIGFERQLRSNEGQTRALSLSFEAASRGFAPVGPEAQPATFAWRAAAEYVHAFSETLSAGIGIRAERERLPPRIAGSYRAYASWAVAPMVRLTLEASHADAFGRQGPDNALRIGIRIGWRRLGTASADYDSASSTTRLAYQRAGGDGVGAYGLLGEIERSPRGAGFNVDAHYVSNRAELGFSRFTNLEGDGSSVTELRLDTAIAFADGAVSVGRPVRDSFAILTRHPALGDARVEMDRSGSSYAATTGSLGTAMRSDLSAYLERIIAVQAPDAPVDVDLQRGFFRLLPAYRSGYRLRVGSDYSVSVTGRLLGGDGAAQALIVGHARESATGVDLPFFTNGAGRFGATGLRAGRWRLVLATDPPTEYLLDIPPATHAAFAAGDLRPETPRP